RHNALKLCDSRIHTLIFLDISARTDAVALVEAHSQRARIPFHAEGIQSTYRAHSRLGRRGHPDACQMVSNMARSNPLVFESDSYINTSGNKRISRSIGLLTNCHFISSLVIIRRPL